MAKIGYARVSSNTQDYRGQVDALKVASCERIYSEKMSGKSTNGRRQFEKLMKDLLPGETVVVALIFMGYLAFYQKHEGCWRGHSLKNPHQHCGSMDVQE